eukprot:116407_1
MGIMRSKNANTASTHDSCNCKMYNTCGHCCDKQCLGERYLDKKRKQLSTALKQYNCEYLTNTIMEYLAKLEIIQFNCLHYHDKYLVYIHSITVDIWPELPCLKWRQYIGCVSHSKIPEIKEVKIVVLGNGGVGKSALVIRLVTDNFLEEYDPTIEDSYRKIININGQQILCDVLDTAGREEFSSMEDQWIREGSFFLLCFAVNNNYTFEEIILKRERILRVRGDD